MKNRVFVLDDDRGLSRSLKDFLFADNYDVLVENDAGCALDKIRAYQPDVAIVDVMLQDRNGLDVLQQIKEIDPNISVIIITGQRTRNNAIRAMQNGAFDFLVKPLDPVILKQTVKNAVLNSLLNTEADSLPPVDNDLRIDSEVEIASPDMLDVWKKVGSIARSNATVLLHGESGTGKEVIAQAIHKNSLRSHMPFLAVNCAALPDTLLESELFGHEKGAFTGAYSRKPGKFEQCEGGTLFLDEVAEMSLANQGKLLRVLENRTFERVGGQEELRTDVRIIAASNKSLMDAVKEKKFRLDLMYRLKVITLHLPPLRERFEDLVLLADLFVRNFAEQYEKPVRGIAPDALELLKSQRWEGNIRELKNVINSAVLLSKGNILTVDDFLPLLPSHELPDDYFSQFLKMFKPVFVDISERNKGKVYDHLTFGLQKALVRLAMDHSNNNQVAAATMLGISRNTLRDRIEP